MARDEISLQYLTYDATDSVGSVNVEKQAVTQANGIKLKNAFACKDNSMKIIVENTATSDSTLTIKAGEKQNATLGDATIALTKNSSTVIAPIRDMARFENADGSIDIDFATGFTGNIYAVGEKAGL
ncbi:TPA: hypothetical protein CPT89_01060 [Candidatus Gastranaerophilales bacterium HUM_11]|nr:MAG TPA: hypothetical protein CPT89_01060 [Candidatus Gastranaerophilales bacterium HUM_11]